MKFVKSVIVPAVISSLASTAILYTSLNVLGLMNGYNFGQKLAFVAVSTLAIAAPTIITLYTKKPE